MAMFFSIAAACAISFWIFYFYRKFFVFRRFKHDSIPGPEPHWYYGNLRDITSLTNRHMAYPTWTKQFGKLYVYFEGPTPTLVTSDLDLVQQIYVTNFTSFHGHKLFAFQADPDTTNEPLTIAQSRGKRWKRMRSIASPLFTTGKMKAIMPLIQRCQNDLLRLLEGEVAKGDSVNVLECYRLMTMDTISEAALGVELKGTLAKEGERHPVFDLLSRRFSEVAKQPLAATLALLIPKLTFVFRSLDKARGKVFKTGYMDVQAKLWDMMRAVINDRKLNKSHRRVDLLQMMIDYEEDDLELLEGQRGITTDEIVGQATFFMNAGFETSSATLAFASFLLAHNPKIQDKLLEEIDRIFPDPDKVADYDTVSEMKYLEATINETMRLFPVATFVVSRVAADDVTVKGIHFPKEMAITVDTWSIHRDEEQWGPVDVEQFYPDRFLPEYPSTAGRHEAAFMPFGYGPRICIGQRFAMQLMKLTLLNVLRNFRFELAPKTGSSLTLTTGFITNPTEVWLKLRKNRRNK